MIAFARTVLLGLADLVGLARLAIRPRQAIAGENLILRRQLALYKERATKPRRIDAATRLSLAWRSRGCDWRSCLVAVRPETVIRWHRAGWRLPWRCKSRPGRPRIPPELRPWIRRVASENALWGEARIANSSTIVICSTIGTASSRGTSIHPPPSIERLGLTVLRAPPNSLTANAICERLIGTMRRECLDWLIPMSASHLRSVLRIWVSHYNGSRPHVALGPRVPDASPKPIVPEIAQTRHRIGEGLVVLAKSVLGGLHHEYSLVRVAR